MEAGRLIKGMQALAIAALAFPGIAYAGNGTFTASPDGPLSVGSTPNAIGIADFNQDGDPDLAVTNRDSSDLNVLAGAAGSTFTPSAVIPLPPGTQQGGGPADITVGDFNGDSDPDLVVSNPTAAPNSVTVFTGGAGLSFTSADIAIPQRPTEIAISDFNADGDQDLAVLTFSNNRVSILTGGAGSTFAAPVSISASDSPSAIAAGDFNADGDPDLAITSLILTKVTVLLGGNLATFTPQAETPATGGQPSDIVAADFTGDADPDLAITNAGSDDVTLLTGQPGGPGFASAGTSTVGDGPSAIASGDFNSDGDPDLAVANQAPGTTAGTVSILLGGSGATFAPGSGSPLPVGAEPLGLAMADFNADGNQDLASADGGVDTVTLLLGNGSTTQPPPPPGSDKTPPQTTIDKGPPAKTDKAKAKIRYSANEAATFECKLKGKGVDKDLRQFADCGAAKIKYKRLDPGKKKFQVRAVDAAGNVDPSPAKLKWKVLG